MSQTNKNKQYMDQIESASFYADSTTYAVNDGLSLKTDAETYNTIGGSVDLRELSILVKDGRKISLLDSYDSIVIEENLFSSFISGAVKLRDTGAGFEKFALTGGEILHIMIVKSGNKDIIVWRQDLVVTKISGGDIDVISGAKIYSLHFSPRTYINSLKTCLFKSYKQQSISDAALSIYREISPNDLFIENSRVTLANPFISAGFMPHKALDYLAQRACTKDKYFVFFERFVPNYGNFSDTSAFTSSHYFGSIDKLVKESEDLRIKTIVFAPKTFSISENATIRASKFLTKDNFNHIPAMQLGFYNSRITSINPITKQVTHDKIAYTDKSKEINDLYEGRMFEDSNIFSIYNDLKNQVPGRKVITSSINDSVSKEQWLKNHIYGYLAKNYFKINVEIQGGTNKISAGHIVKFFTPSQYDRLLNPQNPSPVADVLHSGKYIVTKVTHIISNSMYVKNLDMARASIPFDINRNTIIDSDIANITKEVLGDKRT